MISFHVGKLNASYLNHSHLLHFTFPFHPDRQLCYRLISLLFQFSSSLFFFFLISTYSSKSSTSNEFQLPSSNRHSSRSNVMVYKKNHLPFKHNRNMESMLCFVMFFKIEEMKKSTRRKKPEMKRQSWNYLLSFSENSSKQHKSIRIRPRNAQVRACVVAFHVSSTILIDFFLLFSHFQHHFDWLLCKWECICCAQITFNSKNLFR